MSDVRAVEPDPGTAPQLPGAQFSDAFSISVDGGIDARAAAERMMTGKSWWIDALLALRNIVVSPFGLKGGPAKSDGADVIGIFPVVSQTSQRLVAGFDDRHLDFRVIVDVADNNHRRDVTATTLVLTHNWLGRAYLAAVMPFHKIIVRSMLKRVSL